MIIQVVGRTHVNYVNKENKTVQGYQIYGIVIDDDYYTPDLEGHTVFDAYISCATLSLVPEIDNHYRVIKQRSRDSEGKEYDRYIDLKELS